MDFTTIGTLHSYARIKNLQFAAKHKLKTGQTIASASGRLNIGAIGAPRSNFLEQMMKTQNQKADAAAKKRLAAIKRKLMNGKRLSNEEMGFLLKNDSKLYRKAQKAQEARDELKAALSQAKTKDEARKALMHAKMKASAECMAELDAAKSGTGGGSAPAGGGYEASGDIVGALAEGDGLIPSDGMSEGAAVAENGSAENMSTAGANENVDSATPIANAETGSTIDNASKNTGDKFGNSPATNRANGSSDGEKDTPDDILEKYIMIIRALDDEWQQFAHSKQYDELPEDEIDDAARKQILRADYRTLKSLSAYRAAMRNWDFVSYS